MNEKKLEPIFDKVVDKLENVTDVSGFRRQKDMDRFELDRGFDSDNKNEIQIDELVNIYEKGNDQLNIQITQTHTIMVDKRKNDKKGKILAEKLKPKAKQLDCDINIENGLSNEYLGVQIVCAKETDVPIDVDSIVKGITDTSRKLIETKKSIYE